MRRADGLSNQNVTPAAMDTLAITSTDSLNGSFKKKRKKKNMAILSTYPRHSYWNYRRYLLEHGVMHAARKRIHTFNARRRVSDPLALSAASQSPGAHGEKPFHHSPRPNQRSLSPAAQSCRLLPVTGGPLRGR